MTTTNHGARVPPSPTESATTTADQQQNRSDKTEKNQPLEPEPKGEGPSCGECGTPLSARRFDGQWWCTKRGCGQWAVVVYGTTATLCADCGKELENSRQSAAHPWRCEGKSATTPLQGAVQVARESLERAERIRREAAEQEASRAPSAEPPSEPEMVPLAMWRKADERLTAMVVENERLRQTIEARCPDGWYPPNTAYRADNTHPTQPSSTSEAATVAELKSRCEEVANDLCGYVAMRDTPPELEQFMFRCADKLRGEKERGRF